LKAARFIPPDFRSPKSVSPILSPRFKEDSRDNRAPYIRDAPVPIMSGTVNIRKLCVIGKKKMQKNQYS
jgi:hypothetical protein